MINLLGRKKRMKGGLYFGPAAWMPGAWAAEKNAAIEPARLWLALPTGMPEIEPALAAGRHVRRGEVIVAGRAETESDVLAPCDGTLAGFTSIEDFNGGLARALILLADKIDGPAEKAPVQPEEKVETQTAASTAPPAPSVPAAHGPQRSSDLREILRRAGIGRCAANLPSVLEQLTDLGERPAAAIVLNLLPTQPESRLALGLLTLDSARWLAGLQVLKGALVARRWLMAVDVHDCRAIRRNLQMKRKCGWQTQRLLNRYPQADPTVLLWTLLGMRLPVGELPTRVGAVVIDPITIWALGGWATGEAAMLERPVEVYTTGETPRLVRARLGTRIADLLAAQNISIAGQQCIINGMLAGTEVDAEAAVVQGATMSVSVRPTPPEEKPSPCFSCGWCVDHCPTEINPVALHGLALAKDGTRAPEASEALHCIGCGLCSYVCPTRLPLTQEVLGLRGAMRRKFHARDEVVTVGGGADA